MHVDRHRVHSLPVYEKRIVEHMSLTRLFHRLARAFAAFAMFALSLALAFHTAGQDVKLLNVSYDPTRELYDDLNWAFADDYKAKTGRTVMIEQSHGGSGKQARAVIDGHRADVVTLGLGWDVSAIQQAGLIKAGWQSRLPGNASPYTSSVVLVVRKGNPKGIKDWDDLVKPGMQVIAPNPKTSGGGRWTFLAAYGYAGRATGTLNGLFAGGGQRPIQKLDDERAKAFVSSLYKNIPVLDTGARGSTVTFAQKNIGDALIAGESEAWLAQEEFGKDKFEIVYPSVSILAEPPVAVVDRYVDERGTREVAEAYLKFLYTPDAQEIIGAHHYRPRNGSVLKKLERELPPIKLFTVGDAFGGWEMAQPKFFGDGGVFDQLYERK